MKATADNMRYMGRRKNPADDKANESKARTGYPVFARISDDLGKLLDDFLAAQPYRVTLASFLEKAIKEQLAREGFELPKPKKGGAE